MSWNRRFTVDVGGYAVTDPTYRAGEIASLCVAGRSLFALGRITGDRLVRGLCIVIWRRGWYVMWSDNDQVDFDDDLRDMLYEEGRK